ncbi:MAG TPA: polysaccharide biosynthesis/export family protein [Candidatus Acidoferrum sp.]|nr:polysaccharide biosynthesis/export family protein [Candidatus Acidoferrum sp.]
MAPSMNYAFRLTSPALVFLGSILALASATKAQSVEPPGPALAHSVSQGELADEYTIAPSDVLTVSVADAPEFGGRFRVSGSGVIEIPGVSNTIQATGKTPIELAHSIRLALIDAGQLRDPQVSVFVDEYRGRTITVLGAVNKPAVYPLERKSTVLDAVSMAGGALPGAGHTVTIVRGRASAEATGTEVGSVQIIDMSRLVDGGETSANVQVQNGDVINVSAADVVYVVGAVMKPGGFVMSNPSAGISVAQAVALAEGFKPTAASHHGLIIRESTSKGARQEIPVDIEQILHGNKTDALLAPNDILFVPESGGKKSLKVLGDVARAAVDGIAIYGVGYRVGNVN